MRTRIKICGITNPDDALAAADAGADAIGMVLGCAASPRCIAVDRAAEIAAAMPPFLTVVALFVDSPGDAVHRALREARVQLLQFHGDEAPEFCAQFAAPYIKGVRMAPEVDLVQYASRYRGARGLLLDAYVAGQSGGTGQTFDWNRIPSALSVPVILSGGLHPGNVREAIRRVHPVAVDVASGVERDGMKGIKDHAKIRAFVREVQEIDAEFASR
jgi:phosphoribosylanthranilate isomerase